ncbi:carboxypeptidase-like regulatory domain-containing protein [Polaromonas sp. P2-4]|nr:carboxypeptidase-like regulatory domain-containing protein [Polaromonas sp. P2-4]
MLLPGAAALAGDPIPGVDVKLGKNPGGSIMVSAATGADGAYQFKGLAPGNYDLFVGGQRVQTISVGANRSISGVLSRDGGKASITFNGQVGVVPDLPSAPASTTRSHLPRSSKVAENESPRPTNRGMTVAPGDVNGDGVETRKAAPKKPSAGRYSVDFDASTAAPSSYGCRTRHFRSRRCRWPHLLQHCAPAKS